MHALHILQTTKSNNICMIMGGVHINSISALLPSMGYCKVRTVGTDSLTDQEYKERTALADQVFNVQQLIPTPSPVWSTRVWQHIKRMVIKNKLADQVVVDTEKMTAFNKLNTKLTYVTPLEAADFEILKESVPIGVQSLGESDVTRTNYSSSL